MSGGIACRRSTVTSQRSCQDLAQRLGEANSPSTGHLSCAQGLDSENDVIPCEITGKSKIFIGARERAPVPAAQKKKGRTCGPLYYALADFYLRSQFWSGEWFDNFRCIRRMNSLAVSHGIKLRSREEPT